MLASVDLKIKSVQKSRLCGLDKHTRLRGHWTDLELCYMIVPLYDRPAVCLNFEVCWRPSTAVLGSLQSPRSYHSFRPPAWGLGPPPTVPHSSVFEVVPLFQPPLPFHAYGDWDLSSNPATCSLRVIYLSTPPPPKSLPDLDLGLW